MLPLLIACLYLSKVTFTLGLVQISQPIGANGSVTFLAVGDWGRKGAYNQSAVAHVMGEVGAKQGIDFVVSTGDNFYEDGLTGINDPAFAQSFSRIYTAKSLQKPWYSGFVHIFFVDTIPFLNHYFGKNEEANKMNWKGILPREKYISNLLKDLKSAIRSSNATWKIVVGHHPIRSIGFHGDTKELLHQLLPILQANKIPMYINGHEHCLEHISNIGTPVEFLTTGGGSMAWRNVTHYERYKKNLKFYHDGQGFITVQLTKSEAKVTFYDGQGKTLHSFKLNAANNIKAQ
ncbi:hypothetical protein DH2020_013528 [Rehmannia glutinosa]|uniref:acid phosphatase n=1 Tax=Rehmannia glutinosa TaxID=99300 RepID=A0ABR0X5V9_REHGL